MKILLINKFHYQRGGSETYYFAQAEALQELGHEIIYFAMKDDKNVPCKQEEFFVTNVNYTNKKDGIIKKIISGFKIFYSFEAKKKLEELILLERPDIAHIGLLHRQITFSVIDVLKKYKIPSVMTMHDLIFACPNYMMLTNGNICNECMSKGFSSCIKHSCVKNSKIKSILGFLEANFLKIGRYYNKIDLYIAECQMYKTLMEKSKFTKSSIKYHTNFLPMNQKYYFNPNYENYILYFGRFSQEKGVMTLLKAHELSNCKYKLTLVGAGPEKDNIEDYIKIKGLKNIEVKKATYGSEMEKIIELAKVIVIPSEWYENCPYALLQSIAKGKIVIASRIGGLPELLDDGKTGFLYNVGDVEDLNKKIDAVMQMDKTTYESMANTICSLTEKKHHWRSYIEWLLFEYQLLINKN